MNNQGNNHATILPTIMTLISLIITQLYQNDHDYGL